MNALQKAVKRIQENLQNNCNAMIVVETGTGFNTEIQDFARIHRQGLSFVASYLRRLDIKTDRNNNPV